MSDTSVNSSTEHEALHEKLPEFLKPRFRIFMSIDLVGSTALKQSEASPFNFESPLGEHKNLKDTRAKWFNEVIKFYREIEIQLLEIWREEKDKAAKNNWPIDCTPHLWKTNGDELIYTIEVKKPIEAFFAIHCWLKTATKYREKHTISQNNGLDVKASAWSAGFPITNSEIVVQSKIDEQLEDDKISGDLDYEHLKLLDLWHKNKKCKKQNSNLVLDFIGPSIDTGFRISALATPRKFTISLDLAFILSLIRPPECFDHISFRFDGTKALKGVIGNLPYPIFWIDTHTENTLSKLEDKLISPHDLSPDDIRKYCSEFIQSHRRYLFKPFIYQCGEPLLEDIPKYFFDNLKNISEKFESETKKLKDEKQSFSETNNAPNSEQPSTTDTQTFTNQIIPIKTSD